MNYIGDIVDYSNLGLSAFCVDKKFYVWKISREIKHIVYTNNTDLIKKWRKVNEMGV